jgi:hypothetical protein
MTLSQQGVRLGLASVQLELSLRLRLVLKDDPEMIQGFARAVVGAWDDVASERFARSHGANVNE